MDERELMENLYMESKAWGGKQTTYLKAMCIPPPQQVVIDAIDEEDFRRKAQAKGYKIVGPVMEEKQPFTARY